MKIQLLLSDTRDTAQYTRQTWQAVCDAMQVPLQSLTVEDAEGSALARQLELTTFPALVVDGTVKAVGTPSKTDATRILENILQSS